MIPLCLVDFELQIGSAGLQGIFETWGRTLIMVNLLWSTGPCSLPGQGEMSVLIGPQNFIMVN